MILMPESSDVGGTSRAFVDQCVNFIYSGPDIEVLKREMKVENSEEPMYSNPLLTLPENKSFAFFPYRAHREVGTFVAYTIVKALQCGLSPGINLDVWEIC